MNRWIVVPSMLVMLGVAGCGPIRPTGGGGPIATANDCNTTSGKCEVIVSVTEPCNTAGNIKADPSTLMLAGKPNRTLFWTLPTNYSFCRTKNDLVMFKYGDLDFQFTDPQYTSDPTGGEDLTPGDCKPRFRWKDKNDPHTYGKSYGYYLSFTGPNGTCFFDPFIRNG